MDGKVLEWENEDLRETPQKTLRPLTRDYKTKRFEEVLIDVGP